MVLKTIDPKKAQELAEYLKTAEFSKGIDELAEKTTREVSARIDCLTCANCCKTSPPIIIQSDIKRISKHIGISKKQFKRKYILEDVNGEMSFMNIPCSFLQEDNRCSIYEVRPEACRQYPHTDNKGFGRLRNLHAKNVGRCPIAFEVVNRIVNSIEKN